MNGRKARQARQISKVFASGGVEYIRERYKNIKRILTRGGQ